MIKPFVQTPQMVKNGQTFDALPIGGFFTIIGKKSYYLIDRYVKIGADRVQCVGDGRQWNIANTQIPGSGIILVPEGTYSATTYDVDWRK